MEAFPWACRLTHAQISHFYGQVYQLVIHLEVGIGNIISQFFVVFNVTVTSIQETEDGESRMEIEFLDTFEI